MIKLKIKTCLPSMIYSIVLVILLIRILLIPSSSSPSLWYVLCVFLYSCYYYATAACTYSCSLYPSPLFTGHCCRRCVTPSLLPNVTESWYWLFGCSWILRSFNSFPGMWIYIVPLFKVSYVQLYNSTPKTWHYI